MSESAIAIVGIQMSLPVTSSQQEVQVTIIINVCRRNAILGLVTDAN